jgi:WhiB family redox-sensing transcriptional regulator
VTWQSEAACRGMDASVFFPTERVDRSDTNAARLLYRDARTICFTCPVRTQCLDNALINGDVDYGMFGGLAPTQRKQLLRQQPPHGTLHRYRAGCQCGPCRVAWVAFARNRRRA